MEPDGHTPSDPHVIAVLVENHRRFLKFLEARVGTRAAAEDILQSAFVKGVEKSGGLRDGESAIAWFYRLLRNAIVDHHRRRAAEARALDRESIEAAAVGDGGQDLDQIICQCVEDLIPTLKPEYAAILTRVDLDGRPVPAAALELGITANHAGVRLHRARLALRGLLKRSCGACTEHGCLDCTCVKSQRGRADTCVDPAL